MSVRYKTYRNFGNSYYLEFNMLYGKCPLLKVRELSKYISLLTTGLIILLYVDYLLTFVCIKKSPDCASKK
jgi:hypothetical protein